MKKITAFLLLLFIVLLGFTIYYLIHNKPLLEAACGYRLPDGYQKMALYQCTANEMKAQLFNKNYCTTFATPTCDVLPTDKWLCQQFLEKGKITDEPDCELNAACPNLYQQYKDLITLCARYYSKKK